MNKKLLFFFTASFLLTVNTMLAQTSTFSWEGLGLASTDPITTLLTDQVDDVTISFGRRFIGTAANIPPGGFGVTNNIRYMSTTSGNHIGFAEMRIDHTNVTSVADLPNDKLVLTIKFSTGVTGLKFSLLDVDAAGSGTAVQYKDAVEVFFNGSNNARTAVGVTTTLKGSSVVVDDESYMTGWEGNSDAAPTDTTGNIFFNFGAVEVDSITIIFFSSDDAQNNPVSQFIGLSDFTFDTPSLLPVSIIHFQADFVSNFVQLNWQTATETNNNYFTIEKSVDGINWQVLQTVEGAGNSSSLKQYSIDDYELTAPKLFYRLSQTDFDGVVEILGIATVMVTPTVITPHAEVFPNPSNGDFVVEFDGKLTSCDMLTIRDYSGKIITGYTIIKEESKYVLSGVPRGFYIVYSENTCSGTTYKQNIIID